LRRSRKIELLTDDFVRELHRRMLNHVWKWARHGQQPFTWGARDLDRIGEPRERYLAALRTADARDYGPLVRFVRS
jgi:hypothetical protein